VGLQSRKKSIISKGKEHLRGRDRIWKLKRRLKLADNAKKKCRPVCPFRFMHFSLSPLYTTLGCGFASMPETFAIAETKFIAVVRFQPTGEERRSPPTKLKQCRISRIPKRLLPPSRPRLTTWSNSRGDYAMKFLSDDRRRDPSRRVAWKPNKLRLEGQDSAHDTYARDDSRSR